MMQKLAVLRCIFFLTIMIGLSAVAVHGQMPALSPLPGTGSLSAPANSTKFTFVVAGDNRPAHSSDPQPSTPGEIFAAASKLSPAFVMWTGDTIYGKDPTAAVLQKEYTEFLGIAKTAGAPVFNAPGNHELDDANDVPNAQMLQYYTSYMGLPYGAFTYGNSRFITLNSEEQAPSGTTGTCSSDQADSSESAKDKDSKKDKKHKKDKPNAPGYIDPTQLTLLQQDLDANKTMAHILIFMHHPVEAVKCKDALAEESVQALEALFKNYSNVSYVISGHEHLYYNPQSKGKKGLDQPPNRTDPSQPPYYLVTGGAGAPLNSSPGGFYNYLVFKVDGAKIKAEMIQLKK
jgi:hypothetical protein